MPYGKFESHMERELSKLSQKEYEKVRTLVHELEKIIGIPDSMTSVPSTRFPHTAVHLAKMERALMFLENDHGGKFDW